MTKQIVAPLMLLNGELVGADEQDDVINPATGTVVAQVPVASVKQLDLAVAAARRAAPAWANNPTLRSATLAAMAGIVTENRDALARMISLETGLPFKVAQDEVGMASLFLGYRSKGGAVTDTVHDDEKQRVEVVRRPAGIVGAIIPWNAPMMIACEKIGTAFAAGNTVVIKPSPLAPLALLLFGQLMQTTIPPGVLNILTGGDDLGAALVAHPDIAMISFTGSISAGRSIMANAAPLLKRLSLELGGNDAAIVLGDVNVAKTAPKLFFGAFYRGGQVCAAIKRLYVHRSILDDMVSALRQLAEQAVLGDPFDEAVTMGPLSNRQQFEKVTALVADSIRSGGRLVTGGAALDRPGYFFAPTLITTDDPANPLVVEEQFGPVLPIIAFDDVEDALRAANATSFGLGGSVWTDDIDSGVALARRLESGSAWVNRHGVVMPDTPFGGMKQSGMGRANGQPGLDSYAELQTISVALPRK
jgi:acyl-CoA reductase-like NAD-dependent aldehyde dehydrogenase